MRELSNKNKPPARQPAERPASGEAPSETAPLGGSPLGSRTERRRRTIIDILYWALSLLLIYVVFKYAVGYVLPFVIALIIAVILKPLIKKIAKLTKIKSNLVAVVTVALFYSTVGLLLVIGVISLITYLISWIPQLSDLYYKVEPELRAWVGSVNDGIKLLDPQVVQAIESIFASLVDSLSNMVGELSGQAVRGLRSILTGVPGFFINVLFTIVATFFFAADYGKVTGFVIRQLPSRTAGIILDVKRYLGVVLMQFISSYAIILLITFSELSIGFLILGIKNVFLMALLVSVFDILPVVGLGAVLLPWAVISLIGGNMWLGIGLLVMYVIMTVVRNIIEPRIVGNRVGLHPLLTLICMFVGARLFGAVGLIGLPIAASILKSLNDKGAIRLYR